jgi:hypothetical protein
MDLTALNESFQKLLSILHSVRLENKEVLLSLGMKKETALERGLKLVSVSHLPLPSPPTHLSPLT